MERGEWDQRAKDLEADSNSDHHERSNTDMIVILTV